jgi:predicted enzyme related to lactoylglutathione lyase
MADTGGAGGINGGFMKPQEGPWPGNMALYMAVDDLASTLEKVKAAGGRVIVERQEIPGMGALALFADPEDRVLGLWVMASPAGA